MNFKLTNKQYQNFKFLIDENFDKEGLPSLKYYSFDWDDNIVTMPTEIILKNSKGDEVGMSTEDFATYRSKIGKVPFMYKGQEIVEFADNSFRNFQVQGDSKFLKDVLNAKEGPAWEDFKEAINHASIFSIVTARGHNPNTLKKGVYMYIMSNHNGINSDEVVNNIIKFKKLANEPITKNETKEQLVNEYLNLCKFYPVSFGSNQASSPEQGKIDALTEFLLHVKNNVGNLKELIKNGGLITKVNNSFMEREPMIGFSDDDLKNVEKIKGHFDKNPKNNLKTYSTYGGIKKLQ